MPTQDPRKPFWEKLKSDNSELFTGTSPEPHYFDVNIKGLSYIKIRLNLYSRESDYKVNGVQSISLVISAPKLEIINNLFEQDCSSIKNDCVIIRYKNANINQPIPEDESQWQPYIDWFVKYTQKLKDLLESWK